MKIKNYSLVTHVTTKSKIVKNDENTVKTNENSFVKTCEILSNFVHFCLSSLYLVKTGLFLSKSALSCRKVFILV